MFRAGHVLSRIFFKKWFNLMSFSVYSDIIFVLKHFKNVLLLYERLLHGWGHVPRRTL